MPTIDTTSPIIVPSTGTTAAGTSSVDGLKHVMGFKTDTAEFDESVKRARQALADMSAMAGSVRPSKVKAATAAPKGLMAGKPKHESRNKGQVPWNKGLKLGPGGKRPKGKVVKEAVARGTAPSASRTYSTQAAAENAWLAWLESNFSFDQFTQPPAEVRQFKSKFKKGTNYDKGYEAGYQEAIHDMTMILVAQVGRKQL